jgi:hypothetical protein
MNKIRLGALQIEHEVLDIKEAFIKNIYPKSTFKYYPNIPPIIKSIQMYYVVVDDRNILMSLEEIKREVYGDN